jgi:hypothetical protein
MWIDRKEIGKTGHSKMIDPADREMMIFDELCTGA